MTWNIFWFIGPAKYPRAPSTAKKIPLFPSIVNTSCTIVLSYAITMIIRIYSIMPIELQVSKTEGLARLH